MSLIGSLASLSGSYLQSLLGVSSPSTPSPAATSTPTTAVAPPSDNGSLSPVIRILNSLQHLSQNNPARYAQVTQQISANLTTAANAAQSTGNTAGAAQLNQLATDFSSASTTGQLPGIQDLAAAVGRYGHHGHHHTSAAQTPSAAYQTQSPQATSQSVLSIIQNTLTGAGI